MLLSRAKLIRLIAFDVDGAKEIVIDGQTGYLVPPGSR